VGHHDVAVDGFVHEEALAAGLGGVGKAVFDGIAGREGAREGLAINGDGAGVVAIHAEDGTSKVEMTRADGTIEADDFALLHFEVDAGEDIGCEVTDFQKGVTVGLGGDGGEGGVNFPA